MYRIIFVPSIGLWRIEVRVGLFGWDTVCREQADDDRPLKSHIRVANFATYDEAKEYTESVGLAKARTDWHKRPKSIFSFWRKK